MLIFYHNPKCSKSREGLDLLKNSKKEFRTVEYLKDKLTIKELELIIQKLKITPIELVRQNEAEWKENFKGKELTNKEIIEAMVQFPKLIQRPIVVSQSAAVLGRPIENIIDFIKYNR